jgi:hypothetical protein
MRCLQIDSGDVGKIAEAVQSLASNQAGLAHEPSGVVRPAHSCPDPLLVDCLTSDCVPLQLQLDALCACVARGPQVLDTLALLCQLLHKALAEPPPCAAAGMGSEDLIRLMNAAAELCKVAAAVFATHLAAPVRPAGHSTSSSHDHPASALHVVCTALRSWADYQLASCRAPGCEDDAPAAQGWSTDHPPPGSVTMASAPAHFGVIASAQAGMPVAARQLQHAALGAIAAFLPRYLCEVGADQAMASLAQAPVAATVVCPSGSNRV